MSDLESLLALRRPGRRVHGIAATLLPLREDGSVHEEDFVRHVCATHAAGLTNAVNMDTGYANYLSDAEKRRVLELTRAALGPGVSFVAGAYIDGKEGDLVALYRGEIEAIAARGGTPILFQTARLHGRPAAEVASVYGQATEGLAEALAFELGQVFAPSGEIWPEEVFCRILEIEQIRGAKHSSLDHLTEIRRLELRDRLRPEFAIYTGNDLGIDMIEYGSDYLLGLATFCPELFAARDRAWEEFDPAYLGLSHALQHLGNVAFRPPVPAYKHSAAIFLHLTGRISTPVTHPRNPRRPDWETEMMRSCAARLGLWPV